MSKVMSIMQCLGVLSSSMLYEDWISGLSDPSPWPESSGPRSGACLLQSLGVCSLWSTRFSGSPHLPKPVGCAVCIFWLWQRLVQLPFFFWLPCYYQGPCREFCRVLLRHHMLNRSSFLFRTLWSFKFSETSPHVFLSSACTYHFIA